MKIKKRQIYEKIKLVEPYHQPSNGYQYIENPDDWLLFITAIPIIGTIFIMLYFFLRSKKIVIRKVK